MTKNKTNPGHKLPFRVEGYKHVAIDGLAAGIKDADGMWVAKMHPLNGTPEDLERSEALGQVFAASLDAMDVLKMITSGKSNWDATIYRAAQRVLKQAGLL